MSEGIPPLRPSAAFPPAVVHEIQRAAEEGIYEIRGFGTKRRVPSFDDLVLLGASISRYPLEGYRERCATNVVLGTRDGFAILRDPIACKPAVMGETDEWVAMATEYRAIATLPGADRATIWEPRAATVYSWERQ